MRNIIIWNKPNCMPDSVKDRFTVDYEPLFLFVKNKKYYFEQQREPIANTTLERCRRNHFSNKSENYKGFSSVNQTKYVEKINNIVKHKTNNRDWQNGMNVRGKNASMVTHLDLGRNKRCVWKIPTKCFKGAHFATYPETLCVIPIKAGCPENGIVLDPFSGAGTTCLVAKKLFRQYIGIELNYDYIKMAEYRIERDCGTLF